MDYLLSLFVFFGVVYIIIKLPHLGVLRENKRRRYYRYTSRTQIMTNAEATFFHMMSAELGGKYYIFPQVRLSALFDQRVKGQNWMAALRHIDRKSIDYVVCDKQTMQIRLAVELDDWTHNAQKRVERDNEVNRIFNESSLKLVRVRDMSPTGINFIKEALDTTPQIQNPSVVSVVTQQ